MIGIAELWLPILVAAVLVFIVSSVIHTLTPWHKKEFPAVPDEGRTMDALRPLAIPPGEYMLPRCTDHAQFKDPAFIEKLKNGPVMMLTVLPNAVPSMTRSLVQWFIYSLVIGVFVAYITGRTLPAGAGYMEVFRLAGAVGFIAYTVGLWQNSIWYHRDWMTTFRASVDGLVYGLVTAGAFGWLWPGG